MAKQAKISIRVPEKVHARIKSRAQTNRRTMANETLVLIEQGLGALEALQDAGSHA